jgi:hypothetical protein
MQSFLGRPGAELDAASDWSIFADADAAIKRAGANLFIIAGGALPVVLASASGPRTCSVSARGQPGRFIPD